MGSKVESVTVGKSHCSHIRKQKGVNDSSSPCLHFYSTRSCGDPQKWISSTLNKSQRVQTYFCSFKVIQQNVWAKVWLIGVLRIREVITFICSLYHGKEVFFPPFCLGYIRTKRNKFGRITIFTGCSPGSLCCLLSFPFSIFPSSMGK